MNFSKFFSRSGILLLTGLILTACASNPMRERLNKNFVYNCSLQLLEKNVSAKDAERICESSHRAELDESQAQSQEQIVTSKHPRVAQKTRIIAPPLPEEGSEDSMSADEERSPASDSYDDHSRYERIPQRKLNRRK